MSSALLTYSDTSHSFILFPPYATFVFVFIVCAWFYIPFPNASLHTQLSIFASMPDVLGISQDSLSSDVKTVKNETCSTVPREHQLDLLVVSDGDADRVDDYPWFHFLT